MWDFIKTKTCINSDVVPLCSPSSSWPAEHGFRSRDGSATLQSGSVHTHMIKCVWWYACSLVAMTLMDTSGFTWCGLRVCVLLLHPESCLWTKVPPKREWVTNLFQPHVDAAPLTWSLFLGAPRWRAASGCHHIQTLSVSLPYESVLKVETTIYSFFLSFFCCCRGDAHVGVILFKIPYVLTCYGWWP